MNALNCLKSRVQIGCLAIVVLAGSVQAQSTWRVLADSRAFNAVWMATATEGWAVSAGGGVSRTQDGGATWTGVESGVRATLRGVWGSGVNDVWAVGDQGTILRWNGSAWSPVTVTGVTQNLNAIHGTGAGAAWAVGNQATIVRLSGTTWARENAPTGVTDDLFGVWAAPNGNAMAVGERGRGLRYNGTDWVNNATGAGNSVTLTAVWGTAANSVWAVGTGGEIRFWNGTAWAAQASGAAATLRGVQGAAANQVWAVGDGGEVRFFNGTGWSGQDPDTAQNLLAVAVVSASQVVAVGNRRTVARRTSGTWQASSAQLPNAAFAAVWGRDDDEVWFGGAGGQIFRWNGTGFAGTPSGTNRAINAMWGSDHQNVWAVGANGVILKWNGTAWSAQTSGTTQVLNGVWGTSASQVWAVGANGTVLRWNGTAWATSPSGTGQDLNAVWARDASNAWAVGTNGTILKWNGTAWAAQVSGTPRNLLSVWGSGTTVWAGGGGGAILRSTGSTWAAQTSGVSGAVAALTGSSATALWAGAGAAILKGNGTTWAADGETGTGLNVIGALALSPEAVFLSASTGMLFTNQPAGVPQVTVETAAGALRSGEGAGVFGAVEVGQSQAVTVTVRNTGSAPLTGLTLARDGAQSADYAVSALSATSLAPGESLTFQITFAPLNKGVRAATVRLASNDPTERSFSVPLGGSGFYTPVNITQQPVPTAVSVGSPVTFTVTATGTALRYQWRRNGVNITGATGSSYNLPAATTAQAGAYSVVVSNPEGSQTSTSAGLVVGDTVPKTVALPVGSTFSFASPLSGTVTSYAWRLSTGPIPSDPRYTGFATRTLKITRLVEADAATFLCDVVTPGGPLTTEVRLIVYNAPPLIPTPGPLPTDPIVMDEAVVGGAYAWSLPLNTDPLRTPTRFSATGLPTGLVLGSTTGVVTGVPRVALTVARDYPVVFTASNARGKATARGIVRVNPLPVNTTGSYDGPVVRTAGFYNGLGGRVDLTISSSAAYSGSLTLGGTVLSFSGVLQTVLNGLEPTGLARIKRKGLSDLTVSFTVDSVNHRLKDAVIDDGTFNATFAGWRSRWGTVMPDPDRAALAAFVGRFNLALTPPAAWPEAHPQGAGYASFVVSSSGVLTVSGVGPDGQSFTCATFVGPLGEVLVYRALYSNKGSVSGHLVAASGSAGAVPTFSDSGISGTLQWSRPAQNSRVYRNGFGPIGLAAAGGRYLGPADRVTPPLEVVDGGIGTTNAALTFTIGGVNDTPYGTFTSPDIAVRLQGGGKVGLPTAPGNPCNTRLTVTTSTGALSGSFVLLDQNPAAPGTNMTRTVSYRGLIIRDAGVLSGHGHFLLPKRPAAGSSEKPTTTDIISNLMRLRRTP